jgi:hypothetical protein
MTIPIEFYFNLAFKTNTSLWAIYENQILNNSITTYQNLYYFLLKLVLK